MTLSDVADAIADGRKASPQQFGNSALVALRITGTGVAARPRHDEFVHRASEVWLTERMKRRCLGLPIVLEHPESGTLDADSFRASVVGIVVVVYARSDELWAIGRFFDGALADEISRPDGRLSWDTSPAVAFLPGETTKLQLADGSTLLVEGEPTHIDHLALVTSDAGEAGGVWSRGIVNTGIAKTLETEDA